MRCRNAPRARFTKAPRMRRVYQTDASRRNHIGGICAEVCSTGLCPHYALKGRPWDLLTKDSCLLLSVSWGSSLPQTTRYKHRRRQRQSSDIKYIQLSTVLCLVLNDSRTSSRFNLSCLVTVWQRVALPSNWYVQMEYTTFNFKKAAGSRLIMGEFLPTSASVAARCVFCNV